MLKKVLIACAAISMVACNNESQVSEEKDAVVNTGPNTLTEEEKKDGWELLFDGTSTAGWHEFGRGPLSAAWRVVDGTLHLDVEEKKKANVDGDRDIVTDAEFENFDLKMDWKIDTAGNSGIMFYVVEDTVNYKKPYLTGPEMQVLDNERHPDAKFEKHRAGDLYDLVKSSKETVKPPGEWNQVEIKSLNGKLDLYLNGENVVSTTMWDDNWKQLIAASKFKDTPGFGEFKKGRICLQDHGNKVWFRNIKIKRL